MRNALGFSKLLSANILKKAKDTVASLWSTPCAVTAVA